MPMEHILTLNLYIICVLIIDGRKGGAKGAEAPPLFTGTPKKCAYKSVLQF